MIRDGKFLKLYKYFSELLVDEITLSFSEIEKIIQTELCSSARQYPSYWEASKRHTITRSWTENGYMKSYIDLKGEQITFVKCDI